jgi:hypothetical protein
MQDAGIPYFTVTLGPAAQGGGRGGN